MYYWGLVCLNVVIADTSNNWQSCRWMRSGQSACGMKCTWHAKSLQKPVCQNIWCNQDRISLGSHWVFFYTPKSSHLHGNFFCKHCEGRNFIPAGAYTTPAWPEGSASMALLHNWHPWWGSAVPRLSCILWWQWFSPPGSLRYKASVSQPSNMYE